ncbi:hypothetical protein Poli38472_012632 [Pythium oligandrum]|uniref:WRKY19-like zinc finger domain-containing protein n=1 Tax=Pythium oligandrum TaxID=41045 RepID=A0A8K1FGA6_PYTOL|nr:hypothetical protein Poli38472_012632 [Pythium oligandrum]|eukprot:TMW61441.1 hypothetical protein Poli38472_012632 [Pythium oligandrum]
MFGKTQLAFILNPYESPPKTSTLEQVFQERSERHYLEEEEDGDQEMKQEDEQYDQQSAVYRYGYTGNQTVDVSCGIEYSNQDEDDEMDGGDEEPMRNGSIFAQHDMWATMKLSASRFGHSTSPDSVRGILATPTPFQSSTAAAAAAAALIADSAASKKKKITICKEEGCKSQALSKQLCMKHGGGPRCTYPGCNNGAKLRNLCFQHGGSTICLAPDCTSKAKRFGYCWSHGGGRICSEDDCNKVAAQGGLCWAHGGGNRCKLPGCSKRSYKQHDYYCKRHAEAFADY